MRQTLPIEPWAEFLTELRDKTGWGPRDMAVALGTNDNRIRHWMDGSTKGVRLDVVDACLCAFERPDLLREVYPEVAA